jgi:hypothetical protein
LGLKISHQATLAEKTEVVALCTEMPILTLNQLVYKKIINGTWGLKRKRGTLGRRAVRSRLPDFSWHNIPKWKKLQNIPYGYKRDQMAVKYSA